MEDNKLEAVQVEHVNHTLFPVPSDQAVTNVVVEDELLQGINCDTILAFLVRDSPVQENLRMYHPRGLMEYRQFAAN